jgi:hypothetical protein
MAYQEPYPPFLTTLTSVFPQRSHPGRVRLVGEGLVSVDEASAFVEERRRFTNRIQLGYRFQHDWG